MPIQKQIEAEKCQIYDSETWEWNLALYQLVSFEILVEKSKYCTIRKTQKDLSEKLIIIIVIITKEFLDHIQKDVQI